ncbi:putative LOC100569746 [Trichonephila clavipes]|nr:putative LOC100569746 [Trichonephila clavipes]
MSSSSPDEVCRQWPLRTYLIVLFLFFPVSMCSARLRFDDSTHRDGSRGSELPCGERQRSQSLNLPSCVGIGRELRRMSSEFEQRRDAELWFQQDGATCHTARATIDLLKDTLGDRLISRFGPVNWPPRSCELTSLDYFLWDYVKSWVYADKPQTLDHLEDNIRRVIADIRPQMLEVIENWTSRLDYIRASRGSPMPEIIFKM